MRQPANPAELGQIRAVGRQPAEWHRQQPEIAGKGWGGGDRGAHAPINAAVVISPSDSLIRRRIDWCGMGAESVVITRRGRVEFHFRDHVHLLVLLESGTRTAGLTCVEGVPRSALKNYKGKLVFVPAGREYIDWHEARGLVRIAYFYIEPSMLRLETEKLEPRIFFEDVDLIRTALKLKTVLDSPLAHDLDYCEALGRVLAHDLACLVLGVRHADRELRGGLAAWQQQAVLRHIDERLTERVSLTTLADLVRLSPCHFCRAFKQSFDMPPHRFHSHRRIDRARVLLATSTMLVTEVGLAVGFCSPGAFTMMFRKITGMTPTEYRRSVI